MNTRFSSLAALVVTFASFMLGGCAADGEPTSDEGELIAERTSGRANDVATSERANPLAPSVRANDVATSERANPTNGGAAGFARGDSYEESLAVRMVEHANGADAGGPLHTPAHPRHHLGLLLLQRQGDRDPERDPHARRRGLELHRGPSERRWHVLSPVAPVGLHRIAVTRTRELTMVSASAAFGSTATSTWARALET